MEHNPSTDPMMADFCTTNMSDKSAADFQKMDEART